MLIINQMFFSLFSFLYHTKVLKSLKFFFVCYYLGVHDSHSSAFFFIFSFNNDILKFRVTLLNITLFCLKDEYKIMIKVFNLYITIANCLRYF